MVFHYLVLIDVPGSGFLQADQFAPDPVTGTDEDVVVRVNGGGNDGYLPRPFGFPQ